MRPDIFLATIGRGSNGSNALEVTEDRAAVTAESQDNIINRVNNVSQYGPSWHYVPGIGVAGTAYAEVPDRSLGDLAFSRASSKTRTNAAGVVETIGNNVPPHDYRNADGSLSTFPRLNLEPQRTNSIRNSSMVGAVAGTPGTLPTNWTQLLGAGLTRTIVGTGTENGLPYVDVRYNGTATGTSVLLAFETVTGITAANGQVWTGSFYLKTISLPNPPNNYRSLIAEYTSAGVYLRDVSFAITPTSNLNRFSQTETLAGGATTARVVNGVLGNLTNGAAYDFTIRIVAPQMELGAYATTWVPTTTAAVTRIADVASKTGVSSLIGQTEGTMFAEVNWGLKAEVGSPVIGILTLNNNVANNQNAIILGIERAAAGTNRVYCLGLVSNLVQFELFGSNITSNNYKIALAYKQNDFVLYVNGAQIGTDTSGTVPATSQIILGNKFNGDTRVISDGIAQAALFKTRLTNAQLAQLTTL
jgi:hypothetical protein